MTFSYKNPSKITLVFFNISYIICLAVAVFPLLYIGKYNYPCADDWSYGKYTYQAISNGAGPITLIREVFRTVKEAYLGWDGRFGSNFFLALQPGIFGEDNYFIVPYLMIGIIIISEIYLIHTLINLGNKKNLLYTLPIITPWIIIQLMYAPYPVESFYWYSGAFSYTFINGLAIILYSLFLQLAENDISHSKRIIISLIAAMICIIVAAGNYTTMVWAFLTIAIHSAYYFISMRAKFKKIVFLLPVYMISSAISFLAPGRSNTFSTNYSGGENGYSFIETIFLSLHRTLLNIISWTNVVIIMVMLLTIPFMIMATKKTKLKFRFPALITFISFGIYSSMLSPTIYAQGNNGGGRTGDILYYMYIMWMIVNVFYWAGWLITRPALSKLRNSSIDAFLIAYFLVTSGILLALIFKSDWRKINQYNAYRDIKQGWAKQYSIEWEERLVVLHDDSIKNPVFDHLSVNPETILYADLQDEKGYTWVNDACAEYYCKNSITVNVSDSN